MSRIPSVLFVCVHNAGKSQTAAALMRHLAGDRVETHSAGTAPDAQVSRSAATALAAIGVDMGAEFPKAIDPALLQRVDRVVILGSDASVQPVEGMAGRIERWVIGAEHHVELDAARRPAAVRDEIHARVVALLAELDATAKH